MKRILCVILMLVMVTPCFSQVFYIAQPENNKEVAAWITISSLLLIGGLNVMDNTTGNLVSYTAGYTLAVAGCAGFCWMIFEW